MAVKKSSLLFSLCTLISPIALCNEGPNHNHAESHTTTTVVPSTLSVRSSPSTGVSGDISFKVRFSRSGDGGTFCTKVDGLYLGNARQTASDVVGFGGDPIRFTEASLNLCTFTRDLNAEFWEARRYFAGLCQGNNGKTLTTSFQSGASVSTHGTISTSSQYHRYRVTVPVHLECACISPQFSSNRSLNPATVGARYTDSFAGRLAGGAQPIRFTLNGVIPPGMNFGPDGTLAGIPTAPGDYAFTVTARDSCPNGTASAEQHFELQVCAQQVEVQSPADLTAGFLSSPYRNQLVAGGTPPINFSVLDWRDLPAGIQLNAAGLLSGAPSTVGRHRFTIKTVDACGRTKEASTVINVNGQQGCQQLAFYGPDAIATAQVNTPYVYRTGLSGGQSNPNVTLKPGTALPEGLAVDRWGGISGVPKVPGSFRFTLQASGSCLGNAQQAEKNYALTVLGVTDTAVRMNPALQQQRARIMASTQRDVAFSATQGARIAAAAPSAPNSARIISLMAGAANQKISLLGQNFVGAQAITLFGPDNKPAPGVRMQLGRVVGNSREVFVTVSSNAIPNGNYFAVVSVNNRPIKVSEAVVRFEIRSPLQGARPLPRAR